MQASRPNEAINKIFQQWSKAVRNAAVVALCMACLFLSAAATSAEETVYRTGIKAVPRYFSVAPDGGKLVFDTAKPFSSMRVFDMATGKIQEITTEPEHAWEMGSWSADGKRLVAISTGWKNRQYNRDDMKIILIDPRDWSWQVISPTGEKVKITPFFSPDGKKVYYFRGEARTEGATPAARFDLYSIDVASRQEVKLTDDRFYQVGAGDVSSDGRMIYFSKIGGRPMSLDNQDSHDRFQDNTLIVSFDSQTHQLRPTHDFDKSRFVEIFSPRFDRSGRLYFFGSTQSKGRPYIFSVFRASRNKEPAQRLADASSWSRFDIAKASGHIYVSDTRDGEVIFRRITVSANN